MEATQQHRFCRDGWRYRISRQHLLHWLSLCNANTVSKASERSLRLLKKINYFRSSSIRQLCIISIQASHPVFIKDKLKSLNAFCSFLKRVQHRDASSNMSRDPLSLIFHRTSTVTTLDLLKTSSLQTKHSLSFPVTPNTQVNQLFLSR